MSEIQLSESHFMIINFIIIIFLSLLLLKMANEQFKSFK